MLLLSFINHMHQSLKMWPRKNYEYRYAKKHENRRYLSDQIVRFDCQRATKI